MDKFEYLVHKIIRTSAFNLEYFLNQKGLEGWELVNTEYIDSVNTYELIFKRKITKSLI